MSSAYISTKYLWPTNNRGLRIKATCKCGSITVSWDYSLNDNENHTNAMKALVNKLNLDWGNEWTVGSDHEGYLFVPVRKHNVVTL